jgi:intermembrane space import and assembly protein 40
VHRKVQVSYSGWARCSTGLTSDRGMQDCFRQHPEMYGSELEDDEDELEDETRAQEYAKASGEASAKSTPESTPQVGTNAAPIPLEEKKATPAPPTQDSQSTTVSEAQKAGDEGGDLVPKAAYDATLK